MNPQNIRTLFFHTFVSLTILGPGIIYAKTDVQDDIDPGVIIINTPDVTLDCDGATLKGQGDGIGIYVKRSNNVTIMNCQIDNYEHGIYIEDSHNVRIMNMGNKITNTTNQVVLDESTVEETTQTISSKQGRAVSERDEYVQSTPTPTVLPSFKLLLKRVNSKSGDLLKQNSKKENRK